MQCYVLVAVLSLPCVTSLMATLSMETLCAFLRNKKQQKKKKIKNDLLTFPKWIIVLMTPPLDYSTPLM